MTATETAAKITYRKTGKGEWVAYGPAGVIKSAADQREYIFVAKKSGGTDQVLIGRAGREFEVDGVAMCYGYIERKIADTNGNGAGSALKPAAPARRTARMCDECGERRAVTTATDLSGITGDVCRTCKSHEGSLSFC
jgi:hypothetical protein